MHGTTVDTALEVSNETLFFNRELSWVRFNERVLEEAEDPNKPLLERLKFLAIYGSNLDEFFMIRVAGLKEQVNAGIRQRTPDGRTPSQQIQDIRKLVQPLNLRHAHVFHNEIVPQLKNEGLCLTPYQELPVATKEELHQFFQTKLFPALTPLAVDAAHPFPKVRGLGLNLLVELHDAEAQTDLLGESQRRVAVVPIPPGLPRFVHLPHNDRHTFVTTEEVIEAHLGELFPNLQPKRVDLFRVTRNADLELAEAEADDLLKLVERELRKRRVGTVIRLEVSTKMSSHSERFLQQILDLQAHDIYREESFLSPAALWEIYRAVAKPELKDKPFKPALQPQIVHSPDIFSAIRKGDILLLHPYDSFSPVIEFVEAAAHDPAVVAIKQTLYRTTEDSPILAALKTAAHNGKQVTALIELKARFDEKANIQGARELEEAGVNVVYGLVGYKTHCKLSLVLRREADRLVHYVHSSTGNYNEQTAKLYTDLGFFTCKRDIGQDVAELFNLLTGYSRQDQWRQLLVAPITMRQAFEEQIDLCIADHSPEQPASIRASMNSLVDPGMILKLYRASRAGVTVELVVRGICCLVPGLPGVSENIHVRSIVGRFLEHTRIFQFSRGGKDYFFAGSADWMPRNLNRRIEVVFPIREPSLQRKLHFVISAMLKDNQQARELLPDGHYARILPQTGKPPFDVQAFFLSRFEQIQRTIDTTRA